MSRAVDEQSEEGGGWIVERQGACLILAWGISPIGVNFVAEAFGFFVRNGECAIAGSA